jgi:long-chain acyl-CoA synthetase
MNLARLGEDSVRTYGEYVSLAFEGREWTNVERKKDLIIRGGFNVYPREVEDVLYAHPAVAEAAVVGAPDALMGEEVLAFVVLKPGGTTDAAGLVAFCQERLAKYKCPRPVRFVDALPKSPIGKVLRRELRRLAG